MSVRYGGLLKGQIPAGFVMGEPCPRGSDGVSLTLQAFYREWFTWYRDMLCRRIVLSDWGFGTASCCVSV